MNAPERALQGKHMATTGAISDGLRMLRKESITQACKTLLRAAVAAGAITDQEAAKHFGHCYRLRGKIVHRGVTPSPSELTNDSNRLEPTLRELIAWMMSAATDNASDLWPSEFAAVLTPDPA